MQHTKAEGCANKGEIQNFHLHSSSSNEEFLAQDPICNYHIAKIHITSKQTQPLRRTSARTTHKLQVCEVDST